MKIGIVTTWFERGAAYVSRQYEKLLEDQHDVFIYARGGEEYGIGDPEWDRENVHWGKRYPMPVSSTYIDEKDFSDWIQENSIETILFNEQDWWQPLLICKKLGVKTGGYIDYYTESTVKLFDAYDFLICNTRRHYSVFSDHPQCYYIPWGTDINLFQPKKNEHNVLTYFHSSGMNPYRKGTDQLIQAFDKLTEQYTDIKLLIHSQVNLNHFFPSLKNTIENLINKEKLEIIEKTVSTPGLYHLGDVYVYPSRLEGIGLTIVEALSSGLPVITSNNAPMNEFLTKYSKIASIKKFADRKDGYYWPECEVDIGDLKDQMEYFIVNNDKIDFIKNETRNEAQVRFDWNNNKEKINNIFLKAKIIPLKEETVRLINNKDNSRFPYITKIPLLYKYIYKIFRPIK